MYVLVSITKVLVSFYSDDDVGRAQETYSETKK